LRKIGFILLVMALFTGCSVSRKANRHSGEIETGMSSNIMLENVVNQNITTSSFYIEKAEFKIKSNKFEQSGIASIKYIKPDEYLISLKSNTGIEAARIYLSKDSILINDRMNKKFYYGTNSFLIRKYGISTSFLPVILGDFISDRIPATNEINCYEGKLSRDGLIKTIKVEYVIDCDLKKIVIASPVVRINDLDLKIKYGKFIKTRGPITPSLIEISDNKKGTSIEIKIVRMNSPWEGIIEFIPGKQYEKIRLL
jgi:hypothetical protein